MVVADLLLEAGAEGRDLEGGAEVEVADTIDEMVEGGLALWICLRGEEVECGGAGWGGGCVGDGGN